MVLIIDNYDSFTYNLVQAVGALGNGPDIRVVRNDELSVRALAALDPRLVIVSPGPGTPDGAGVSMEAIRHFAGRVPILGVCLGHQCIGQVFGGRVVAAPRLMHGKTSLVHHDGQELFAGMSRPFTATRYHSLIVDRGTLPDELVETAWTEEGELMGLRHRELPIEGVQFHPESFLTAEGDVLIGNFLKMAGRSTRERRAGERREGIARRA